MPINDNGDIIRAVGFVAVYGAYLEDRVAELIDITKGVITFRDNINLLSANEQAKHLLKAITKEFENASDYLTKEQDIAQISAVLSAVEPHLKDRHVVIHSTLTSKSGGDVIIRKNRRTGIEEQVESKEVIDLANDLFSLQSQINGLKFPVGRLVQALSG